jgi:hypothetical protein
MRDLSGSKTRAMGYQTLTLENKSRVRIFKLIQVVEVGIY